MNCPHGAPDEEIVLCLECAREAHELRPLASPIRPGRYEVRVVEEERYALLVLYGETGEALAVTKLTSEQAHEMSVLLVQAAERIA